MLYMGENVNILNGYSNPSAVPVVGDNGREGKQQQQRRGEGGREGGVGEGEMGRR